MEKKKMNFKRFMLKLAGENLARKIRKMKNLINQMRTIDQLAEQMEKVSYDVWNIYPNSIILTDNIKETVGVFRQKNNIPPELNLNVSKSDIMFLYVLRNIKKFAALHNMNLKNDSTYAEKYAVAYDLYLQHGLNSMNIIRKLIEHKYGGIEHVDSFLDFGSGYGKFTRFLTLEIDPSKV